MSFKQQGYDAFILRMRICAFFSKSNYQKRPMKPFWQLPKNSEVFLPVSNLKTWVTFQILLDSYPFEKT